MQVRAELATEQDAHALSKTEQADATVALKAAQLKLVKAEAAARTASQQLDDQQRQLKGHELRYAQARDSW